jgi:germacradienol/geosmin synthase
MDAFRMPEFHMPFDARVNSHVDGCRDRVTRWAESMGLLDPEHEEASDQRWSRAHFEVADFPLFAAWAHPDAEPAELDLMCSWHVLMWFQDDQLQAAYERDPASLRRGVDRFMLFMPVLPQPVPVPENAAERAVFDLWPRTAPAMTPLWRERYTAAFRRFSEGHRWFDRMVRRDTDLFDFVELRREVGGAQMMTCLLEHDTGIEVPPNIVCSRPFKSMLDCFCDAIDLQNDIVSYDREVTLGEGDFNGVTVFQRALGLPLQETVDTINTVITGRVNSLCAAIDDDLPIVLAETEINPGDITTYVRAVETMLAGAYAWALHSPRYNNRKPVPAGPTGLGTSAARLTTASQA